MSEFFVTIFSRVGDLMFALVLVAGGMTLLGYRLDALARECWSALRMDQDGGER